MTRSFAIRWILLAAFAILVLWLTQSFLSLRRKELTAGDPQDPLLPKGEQEIAMVKKLVKLEVESAFASLRNISSLSFQSAKSSDYPSSSVIPTTTTLSSIAQTTVRTLSALFMQMLFHEPRNISSDFARRVKQPPFEIQITKEERWQMYDLLNVFDQTMKKENISYFMYGGTLLGSFRHHDLVPWDDDIDVIISIKARPQARKALTHVAPNYQLVTGGGHDKFFRKDGKRTNQYGWLWPYVDISYYEENATFIWDSVITYGKRYSFPKNISFPLHYRPLLNLTLPAPKDTFAFLVWSYDFGSKCVMFGYSHMVEGGGPYGGRDCRGLSDKFPFVHHFPHQKGIRELLIYRNLTIQDIVVPEPTYAVAETFELMLKPGYSVPSNVPMPKT